MREFWIVVYPITKAKALCETLDAAQETVKAISEYYFDGNVTQEKYKAEIVHVREVQKQI